MTHRFNLFALALLVAVVLPGWWFLFYNGFENVAPKPLAMGTLRQLAGEIRGPAPTSVEAEVIAWREAPRTLLAAGTGLRFQTIAAFGYRLPVEGRSPVVIDAGIDAADAMNAGYEVFHRRAADRLLAAARGSDTVLATSELASLPAAGKQPGTRAPFAAAPGVVVIPAPGTTTPGSRLIYVRLADGREVLFAGSISPVAENWRQLRAAARLTGQAMPAARERETHVWLRTIRNLAAEAPGLIVLPGHDPRAIRYLVGKHLGPQPAT